MDPQSLSKTMHMTVGWSWNISFVFSEFTVYEDEIGLLVLGFLATLLISMLAVVLPSIKSKIIKRLFKNTKKSSLLVKNQSGEDSSDDEEQQMNSKGEIIFHFFYIFFYSSMHILSMMLIMTYNSAVILTIILGMTLGFTLFGQDCDKDKNIPVNCCA